MGIIRMGLPENLVSLLAKEFNIKNFVETGTYYGNTASWASDIFSRVMTIEFSKELYEKVKEQKKAQTNIEFFWGDSQIELEKIVKNLSEPSIFWLDAHWSGGLTYGENQQCPLIEEINILNQSNFSNFILIDDARLFLSPPQPPHKAEQWPNIADVIDALRKGKYEQYIVIIDDVIISVPKSAEYLLASYCQTVNAKAWEEYGKSNFIKGLNLINQGYKNYFYKIKIKLKNFLNSILK